MAQKVRKMGGDFSRMDFKGRLLDNLDLSNSRFVQSHFQQAVLRDAWIDNANLQETRLQEADLRRATLIGSDLREANLDGARMESVDANRANFGQASLVNASLVSANLRHCRLEGANLSDADLAGADLQFATGYTAAQLAATRSLYQTAGIDPAIAAELRRVHPGLFDPPPGFAEAATEYRAAASAGKYRPSFFQTLASLFTGRKHKHKEPSL